MSRLSGVDAARGVALLGMMAVHVLPSADPDGTTSTAYLLVSGRAAALFAVLAGVGVALASGRGRIAGRRWAGLSAGLAARALCVGIVGLCLGALDDSGVAVILVYYGVLFLLAAPLLPLGPRALAGVAVAAAVVVPLVSFAIRDELADPFRDNPGFADLADPARLLTVLMLTGYYPALAWVAYIAAGMAVGRLDLRSRRVAGWLLGGGLALGVGTRLASDRLLGQLGGRAEILSTLPDGGITADNLDTSLERSLFGNVPTSTPWWLVSDGPHSTTPFDLLHTLGTSLTVVGAMLLLAGWLPALVRPLAWVGTMTLTLYTLHVVALDAGWGPVDPGWLWFAHAATAILVAAAWRSRWSRGPLESVVSAVSRRTAVTVGGAEVASRR